MNQSFNDFHLILSEMCLNYEEIQWDHKNEQETALR